jgi:pyruvate dehydrogenase E1 component alpha subunit
MHLADESVGLMGASPVVGDTISLAVGSALASKLDGSNRVAVAYFGDSAVETGQFWEAANFAALHRLPLMLICENNQYATATHISQRQPPSPIYQRVAGFMRSAQVEDGDIKAVYREAKLCRDAQPGFLEIGTYRFRAHVGPNFDWDLGYRTQQEVLEFMARDPLRIVRSKLTDEDATTIEGEIKTRTVAAFESALMAPWPEAIQG